MRVIEPSFEILDEYDRAPLLARLEACGRICYKSEEKITADSAFPFVQKIAEHGHSSVLEMAVQTLRIQCPEADKALFYACQPKYFSVDEYQGKLLVTGSIRALREIARRCCHSVVVQAMMSEVAQEYPCLFMGIWDTECSQPQGVVIEKMELDEVARLPKELLLRHRHVAVKFFVNRAVTHELVRHRACSFLQESQRYCRYSQDKFDNQVTFVRPLFYKEGSKEYQLWAKAMAETEALYLQLLETSTPQAARTVLPNSCKTEIIVYCNLAEWLHILELRTHASAEPSMREVMIPLGEELAKRFPLR